MYYYIPVNYDCCKYIVLSAIDTTSEIVKSRRGDALELSTTVLLTFWGQGCLSSFESHMKPREHPGKAQNLAEKFWDFHTTGCP